MKKKDYPHIILTQLNHFKSTFPPECKIVKAQDCLIRYEDKEEESEFYFQIHSFSLNNSEFQYLISFKPTNQNTLAGITRTLNFAGVEASLQNWGNIIKLFNETDFFDEDPITNFYTKEFFNEYKLLDEDADKNPFDIRRQLIINHYLENSIKFIEKYERLNPEVDLTEPKRIAIELQENLTEYNQNQVILKLSEFWAITRKKGLSILKEIFFELAKEVIKEIGKKMIGI